MTLLSKTGLAASEWVALPWSGKTRQEQMSSTPGVGGKKERKEGSGETWKENPERPRRRGVFGTRPRETRGLTDIARATRPVACPW